MINYKGISIDQYAQLKPYVICEASSEGKVICYAGNNDELRQFGDKYNQEIKDAIENFIKDYWDNVLYVQYFVVIKVR